MPVNRNLNTQPITERDAPAWVCPTCSAGMLRLDASTMKFAMTSHSARASGEQWFDADDVEYRFSALLKCDNTACKEVASVAGTGELESIPDKLMESLEYEPRLFPTYFNPSPSLIAIPPHSPDEVREQLHAAFVSSWGESAAAANRIRVAAELLLDALRVPKTVVAQNKRQRLSLHNRIHQLPHRHTAVKNSLLAIKWLGNHGAHAAEMSQDAVYDALDIFESLLTDLYSEHPRRIARLISAVNRRRGPVRARR
jgi:hypothetical protein